MAHVRAAIESDFVSRFHRAPNVFEVHAVGPARMVSE
jgi:hypothetical protein